MVVDDSVSASSEGGEKKSGCFQISFKSQLKSLSHVVTFQSKQPFSTTENTPCPIAYFEVKIISLECKEPHQFGVGLACENFPM